VMPQLSPQFIGRLLDFSSNPALVERLAADTQDPRMDRGQWLKTLQLELVLLLKWACRSVQQSWSEEGRYQDSVLCLLPRYGFALHLLRRVVPFLALGRTAVVSVPEAVRDDAIVPLHALSRALDVSELLTIPIVSPADLVDSIARREGQVLITGALGTWQHLVQKYPETMVVGATGRCLALLGTERRLVEEALQHLMAMKLPTSCSNVAFAACCDRVEEGGAIVQTILGRSSTAVGLALKEIHPSVVFSVIPELEADGSKESQTIAGYTIVACSPDGAPVSRENFGRDPVAGWPGDYSPLLNGLLQ
jgi:hypothetical protein